MKKFPFKLKNIETNPGVTVVSLEEPRTTGMVSRLGHHTGNGTFVLHPSILDWLQDTIGLGCYNSPHGTYQFPPDPAIRWAWRIMTMQKRNILIVSFKHRSDAMLFKLTWMS